jgi:hypothetical protein
VEKLSRAIASAQSWSVSSVFHNESTNTVLPNLSASIGKPSTDRKLPSAALWATVFIDIMMAAQLSTLPNDSKMGIGIEAIQSFIRGQSMISNSSSQLLGVSQK